MADVSALILPTKMELTANLVLLNASHAIVHLSAPHVREIGHWSIIHVFAQVDFTVWQVQLPAILVIIVAVLA